MSKTSIEVTNLTERKIHIPLYKVLKNLCVCLSVCLLPYLICNLYIIKINYCKKVAVSATRAVLVTLFCHSGLEKLMMIPLFVVWSYHLARFLRSVFFWELNPQPASGCKLIIQFLLNFASIFCFFPFFSFLLPNAGRNIRHERIILTFCLCLLFSSECYSFFLFVSLYFLYCISSLPGV